MSTICNICGDTLSKDQKVTDSKRMPVKIQKDLYICTACDSMDIFFSPVVKKSNTIIG